MGRGVVQCAPTIGSPTNSYVIQRALALFNYVLALFSYIIEQRKRSLNDVTICWAAYDAAMWDSAYL